MIKKRDVKPLILAVLGIGVSTFITFQFGMLISFWAGIYIAFSLWFRSRTFSWEYDVRMLAILLGASLMGTGIFIILCLIVPIFSVTTRGCSSMGLVDVALMHTYMMAFPAIVLIVLFRLRIWFSNR